MKVTCIQMNVQFCDPDANFSHVRTLIEQVMTESTDALVLPETWNTGFFPKTNLADLCDRNGARVKKEIGELAAHYHVNIVAGSVSNFRDGKFYVPFSYFKGATPDNNYTPAEPYSLTFKTNPYSDDNEGYMKVFLESGGADNPREIVLRQRGSDGKWFLWEQFILVGIRDPKSADPWA